MERVSLLCLKLDVHPRKVEGNYWSVGLGRKSIAHTLSNAWMSVKVTRNIQVLERRISVQVCRLSL